MASGAEVYFSSVTRCSETGRQAGPAAQGCNQRPDSSCLPALLSLTFVFPAGCHVAAAPLGIISELQAESRGRSPMGLSPGEALVLHSGKGIS